MTHLLSILLLSLVELLAGSSATADLTFVGDAMQHTPQIQAATRCGRKSGKAFDYSQCFSHVAADIADADYAVANLECPLAGAPYSGYPAFSAPDAYAAALKAAGIDLLLTANNHCLDRRDKGLVRTVSALDHLSIPHIGTYVSASHRDSRLPFIVTVNGIRIAFLAYTYGTNGIGVQGSVVVDYISRALIAADIAAARLAGADAVCVCMHWGIEYELQPVASQRSLADFLVDQGVDLIIGGHPHVVEPMEMRYSSSYRKNVLLVYSLGNFISNQNGVDSRGGAMVKVRLTRLEHGGVVVHDARYKLFFVQKPLRAGDNFVLVPEHDPSLLRPDSRQAFTAFMTRAHNLVLDRNVAVQAE